MKRLAILAMLLAFIRTAVSQQPEPATSEPATSKPATAPAPAASPGNLVLTWSDVEKEIWRKAKPYIDLAPPEIEKQVPDLDHVSWATNQDQLPSILAGIGEQCVDLLKRTPNVIAEERVEMEADHIVRRQRYTYLVLVNRSGEGSNLKEYRMDPQGHPVSESAGSAAQGFASMWTRFFPANQAQSRFRFLGTQKLGKEEALVVAFAQIPDKVLSPGEFVVKGRRISILYQGIAWIDPKSWRILRVREDLLAPRPDAELSKFTAQAHYGAVKVKKLKSNDNSDVTLWLTLEADLDWTLGRQESRERHTYSSYRLYVTKTKIVF